MKYANNDEYNGQWNENRRIGDAVFKEGSTGRIERRIYAGDEVKEVVEVIQEGE